MVEYIQFTLVVQKIILVYLFHRRYNISSGGPNNACFVFYSMIYLAKRMNKTVLVELSVVIFVVHVSPPICRVSCDHHIILLKVSFHIWPLHLNV